RRAHRLGRGHDARPGRTRRAGGAQRGERVDPGGAGARHLRHQSRRPDAALDQRPLPFEHAPRQEQQLHARSLFDPFLLQPTARLAYRVPADLHRCDQSTEICALYGGRAHLRDVPAQLRLRPVGGTEGNDVKAKLAILFALLCLCGAVRAQTKIKMTLDWRFEGQTSFMWLGLQRGYFQKEGLDVQVDAGSGSTAAIQRIHTGAYDMGLGDTSALIEYYGNNPGQTRLQMVYLQYDEAPLAYYALKKSGAKSIADLAGKSITGQPFEVTRKMWPVFARAAKIDPNSVKWVTVDGALRSNAVISGQAFACGGFLTVPLEFEMRGVKREDVVELKVSDVGVRVYGNGLMVSNELIAKN